MFFLRSVQDFFKESVLVVASDAQTPEGDLGVRQETCILLAALTLHAN